MAEFYRVLDFGPDNCHISVAYMATISILPLKENKKAENLDNRRKGSRMARHNAIRNQYQLSNN